MPGLGGFGGAQIIRGKQYTMYTPAWYAARDKDTKEKARTAGAAQGIGAGQSQVSQFETLYPGFQKPTPPADATFGGSAPRVSGGRPSVKSISSDGDPRNINDALNALRSLKSEFQTSATSVPTQVPAQVSAPAAPDPAAAQNAIFAQAKARAGSLARSGLSSLRGELAERGILGGGTEAKGIMEEAAGAISPLSDINVAQQQESLEGARRAGETAYQGALTQRGQDITQRGQEISAREAEAARKQQFQMALLQEALKGLRLY